MDDLSNVVDFFNYPKIMKLNMFCSFQLLATDVGSTWREENIDNSNFVTNKDIDKLIGEVCFLLNFSEIYERVESLII